MQIRSIVEVLALLGLICAQLASANVPVSGTGFKGSEDAATAIRGCYERGARDIHQMARCSGYLVNQEALAACRLSVPRVVCIPPKLCARHLKVAPADLHCVVWSDWLDKPLTAESQRLFRYAPISVTQALRGSTPIVPAPGVLKVCDKPGAADEVARACVRNATLSGIQTKAAECVKQYRGDLIEIATKCLDGKPVVISESEKELLHCVLAADSSSRALTCTRNPALSAITAERSQVISRCGFNARDPMVLGFCLRQMEIVGAEGKQVLATADCLAKQSGGARSPNSDRLPIQDCLRKVVASNKAAQLQESLNVVNCAEKATTKASVFNCLPSAEKLAGAPAAVTCAAKAPGGADDKLLDCFAEGLNEKDRAHAACFARYRNDPGSLAIQCVTSDLKGVPPQLIKCAADIASSSNAQLATSIGQCNGSVAQAVELRNKIEQCKAKYEASRQAHKSIDEARQELASCIVIDKIPLPPAVACLINKHSKSYLDFAVECGSQAVGGEVGRIAKCYTDSDGDTTLTGLCGANLKLSQEQSRLYTCITKASNPNERMLCAASPFLDQKTAKVATCVVENGGDFASSAACAVDIQFPGTQGMNNEWRTAVQCAGASGGEPYTTSGCVATRLTLTELSKCVTGGIGKQDGCFGPNNTIVVVGKEAVEVFGRVLKALDPQQIAGDLVHPGPGNEVNRALNAISTWF